jgi:hypothetical protein
MDCKKYNLVIFKPWTIHNGTFESDVSITIRNKENKQIELRCLPTIIADSGIWPSLDENS